VEGFVKVQGIESVVLCLGPFWAPFPSTLASLSILLLNDDVDADVDVGISAVVCEMSRLTFGLVSMVVGECCGGHST